MPRIRRRGDTFVRWILDEHDLVNGDVFPPTGERLPPINWRKHVLSYLYRRYSAAHSAALFSLRYALSPDADCDAMARKVERLERRRLAFKRALLRGA